MRSPGALKMREAFIRLAHLSVLVLNVGHERNVARSLDSRGQRSLVLSTVAGDTARKDLASLGNVSL